MRSFLALTSICACALMSSAHAQVPDTAPASPSVTAPILPAPVRAPDIAAGTVVEVSFVNIISSRTAKIGDTFEIELATAIKSGERVLIPAGVRGVGEVVDAGKAGFSGKPGKLVLAARYLDVNGQRLALRGMKIGVSGANYYSEAVWASVVFSPIGYLMNGKDIEVGSGTRASAKTSADFNLPPGPIIVPTLTAAAPVAPATTTDAPTTDTPATEAPAIAATPVSATQTTEGGNQ